MFLSYFPTNLPTQSVYLYVCVCVIPFCKVISQNMETNPLGISCNFNKYLLCNFWLKFRGSGGGGIDYILILMFSVDGKFERTRGFYQPFIVHSRIQTEFFSF